MNINIKNQFYDLEVEAEQLASLQLAISDAIEYSPHDLNTYRGAASVMAKLLEKHFLKIKELVAIIQTK